jgi:hypothetical protein
LANGYQVGRLVDYHYLSNKDIKGNAKAEVKKIEAKVGDAVDEAKTKVKSVTSK